MGLVVGLLVSGVACLMISISQQIGIGLIIIAVILAFLFVSPLSPVKRKWWSASSKLGITLADDIEVIHEHINQDNFTIRVGLVAVPSIQIEKICLKLGQKKLWASNWETEEIKAIESKYVSFPNPKLGEGNFNAKLFAYTPDGVSKSQKFSINFFS